MQYSKTLYIPSEELALFYPVGTDNIDEKSEFPSFADLSQRFGDLEASKSAASWSWDTYLDPSNIYVDRFFTFEFDDGTVIDLNWTFIDEGDESDEPAHWYFTGARFGTKEEILHDAGECELDAGLEIDPVPSVTGEYIYRNGDDYYVMTLVEE